MRKILTLSAKLPVFRRTAVSRNCSLEWNPHRKMFVLYENSTRLSRGRAYRRERIEVMSVAEMYCEIEDLHDEVRYSVLYEEPRVGLRGETAPPAVFRPKAVTGG